VVPIQKENEAPLCPEAKGAEKGEEISLPHPALPAVSSPSGVWGRASAENDFIVI